MMFNFIFMNLIANIEAYQNQYLVLVENFTIDFYDQNVMDLGSEVVKINNSNGINFYFKSKIDVAESTMISIAGYKILGKDYGLQVLQIRKPFKEVMQMEQFDLQTLWVRKCRPPMIWPILKGSEYNITQWVPNSTNFPGNLPSGKWKIRIIQMGFNKTKQSVMNFYANFEYYRHKSSN